VLRTCRILGAAVLGVLAIAALTPLPLWIAARYAEPPHLAAADAVVVLGGGLVGPSLEGASLQRMVEGLRLQRRGLAPLIVFTGEPSPEGPSEPEIRARLARELGIPPDVILTSTANTTHEEARAAAALLQPLGKRTVLLVSGSIHLVRARRAFEREGFEVFPAPADRLPTVGPDAGDRLSVARGLVRELVARGYYRLAGYL
jgi:uncharacterized SAM-binding protein YcdF (DUF218 family)